MTEQKEIILLPPQISDVRAMPLISDLQFLEVCTSEALNRKSFGVNNAGVYRGFNHTIGNGLVISIGDASGANTAIVEREGVALTVQGQQAVELQFPAGKKSTAVIEAFYQYGTPTNQVDKNSNIKSATILAVDFDDVLPHHVILFDVTIPTGTTQITEAMISTDRRKSNGMMNHEAAADPHQQYVLKADLDFGETF